MRRCDGFALMLEIYHMASINAYQIALKGLKQTKMARALLRQKNGDFGETDKSHLVVYRR